MAREPISCRGNLFIKSMKIKRIGIVLSLFIAAGLYVLIYHGFPYIAKKWVVHEGFMKEKAGENKAVPISPEKVAKTKARRLEDEDMIKPYGTPAPPGKSISKPEVQAVDPTGKEPMNNSITCLARTIYWEAKGGDKMIMQAIANVVMNRLGHEGFPNTICGIVKQGQEEGSSVSSPGGVTAARIAPRKKGRTRLPRKSPVGLLTGSSKT